MAKRKTVLVVDDDEDVRDYFAAVLQASGFDVVPVGDGEAALRVVEKKPVDLVLTDIRMPRLDGIELARRVAEARPALCVLFVSSSPGRLAIADRSKLIEKPVRPGELVRRVRSALRRRPSVRAGRGPR